MKQTAFVTFCYDFGVAENTIEQCIVDVRMIKKNKHLIFVIHLFDRSLDSQKIVDTLLVMCVEIFFIDGGSGVEEAKKNLLHSTGS